MAMARSHLLEDKEATVPQLTPTDPDDPMQQPAPMLLGKVAFEAYSDHTGGKAYSGGDLPDWEGLPVPVQLAWCAAAVAAQRAGGRS
jgi:hypothetical protein